MVQQAGGSPATGAALAKGGTGSKKVGKSKGAAGQGGRYMGTNVLQQGPIQPGGSVPGQKFSSGKRS
jgi:hypothetical protein